jgi:hypothetical protein
MSVGAGADEYDRFMGRYSVPLAPEFADFDVTCPVRRSSSPPGRGRRAVWHEEQAPAVRGQRPEER